MVKKQIADNRNKVDEFHQRIYNVAVSLADKVHVDVSECIPHILQGRQIHRANPEK